MPRSRSSSVGFLPLILFVASLAALFFKQGPQPSNPAGDASHTGHGVPLSVRSPRSADRVRIAFWNIRDLSTHSRDQVERQQICSVLAGFDAVAICEVDDGEILGELASILSKPGEPWASATSPKVGNTQASAERYGVLYRDDVFDLRAARILPEKPLRQSGVAGLPANQMFDREPFTVTLATDDGRLDFAYVMAHVTYGETVAPRNAEVRLLASYCRDVAREEPDVILCGDFNRNVGDPQSLGWLMDQARLIDTTSPDVPTVIRGTHTYDHILLNPQQTAEYRGEHGVVLWDQTLFPGNERAATTAVSDHRPVWIELEVPAADDD